MLITKAVITAAVVPMFFLLGLFIRLGSRGVAVGRGAVVGMFIHPAFLIVEIAAVAVVVYTSK